MSCSTPLTSAPASQPQTGEKKALSLTRNAISKVKEIMAQQDPVPSGLRMGVGGGGCSGFSYSMAFENSAGMRYKVVTFDGRKVFVDATSMMYLAGCVAGYVGT